MSATVRTHALATASDQEDAITTVRLGLTSGATVEFDLGPDSEWQMDVEGDAITFRHSSDATGIDEFRTYPLAHITEYIEDQS